MSTKILVVDDDADDRELVKKAFEGCGTPIEVAELNDGAEVMKYLNNCKPVALPDVILLDLNMPVMNGFEVLMEIKTHEQFHLIPVYVFTTSKIERDRVHSVRLGAKGMITKPSSYLEWVEVLCPLV